MTITLDDDGRMVEHSLKESDTKDGGSTMIDRSKLLLDFQTIPSETPYSLHTTPLEIDSVAPSPTADISTGFLTFQSESFSVKKEWMLHYIENCTIPNMEKNHTILNSEIEDLIAEIEKQDKIKAELEAKLSEKNISAKHIKEELETLKSCVCVLK